MFLSAVFSIFALIIGLIFLQIYSPIYKSLFKVLLVSWVGHILGFFFYSKIGSDFSSYYFPLATSGTNKMFGHSGSGHILNLVWLVRTCFTGDSFVSTLFFFIIFAFCGNVLWYMLFLKMADILKIKNAAFYNVPAVILLCWPTFLFFSAGIKDAWCAFFIPLLLLSLVSTVHSPHNFLALLMTVISVAMISYVRMYLGLVLLGACYVSIIVNKKWSFVLRLVGILALFGLFFVCAQYLLVFNAEITPGLSSLHFDYQDILRHAVGQQQALEVNTAFPMPKSTALILPLLPYSFIMNLCFPLFLFANNLQGVFVSFENMFLIYLMIYFFKYRAILAQYAMRTAFVKFLFFFFVLGVAFIAMINTNFGTAVREKMMFLPAFLILVCLIYLGHKKNQSAIGGLYA